MRILAPAKLNLCLHLGPRREDGLHELCSLFEPLSLADPIEVGPADRDEVVCPGVAGVNLAARALDALRRAGWIGPPVRVDIEKRIPVAAGLGGGSADAAAVLRLARGEVAELEGIAAAIGADVPSQLQPALSLVSGAGELVRRLPGPAPHWAVLLPGGGGLGTGDVFAEADRLGLGRPRMELERLRRALLDAAGSGQSPLTYRELLINDLQPAAISLRPQIEAALAALREVGSSAAAMSGSGPTAFGLFASESEARRAAAELDRADTIVSKAGTFA